MKTIGGIKISKEIERHIKGKMTELPSPYEFKIQGTASANVKTNESALAAFEKIKAWAEKNFAEVTLLENTYVFGGLRKNQYLKVKITDPAAFVIEELLKPCKHKDIEVKKLPGWLDDIRICKDCGKYLERGEAK